MSDTNYLSLDCTPYPVIVRFTTSTEIFEKEYEIIHDRKVRLDDEINGMSTDSSDGIILVGVFNKSITTLIHELNHTVIKVF